MKSPDTAVLMSRPLTKSLWYSRYSPRTSSQKMRFWESKYPSVMMPWSAILVHRMPSGDL